MNEIQRQMIVQLMAQDVAHQNMEEWVFEKKLIELGLVEEEIEAIEDAVAYYRGHRR